MEAREKVLWRPSASQGTPVQSPRAAMRVPSEAGGLRVSRRLLACHRGGCVTSSPSPAPGAGSKGSSVFRHSNKWTYGRTCFKNESPKPCRLTSRAKEEPRAPRDRDLWTCVWSRLYVLVPGSGQDLEMKQESWTSSALPECAS